MQESHQETVAMAVAVATVVIPGAAVSVWLERSLQLGQILEVVLKDCGWTTCEKEGHCGWRGLAFWSEGPGGW